jgi:hypothetical protein
LQLWGSISPNIIIVSTVYFMGLMICDCHTTSISADGRIDCLSSFGTVFKALKNFKYLRVSLIEVRRHL